MRDFINALSSSGSSDESFSLRLQKALAIAEDALMQAKLALAAGDAEAANIALDEAGEAHALAQELRSKRRTQAA